MTKENTQPPAPGSVYRLVVRSAEEAVQTIREQFGASAKVLSVKQQEGNGLMSLFMSPKLEVLVQVGETETPSGESFVGAGTEQGSLASAAKMAALAAASAQPSPALAQTPAPAATPTSAPKAPSSEETIGSAGGPSKDFGAQAKAKANEEGKAPASPTEVPRIVIRKSDFGSSAPSLPDLLRRAGFSETFLARATAMPSWELQHDRPLHVTLVELGRDLRKTLSLRKSRPLPARTAFIGTRGVGRTTALCKWLGAEVFARGHSGRVLKVEFDQPNSAENLAVYCEALGLSMEHYSPDLNVASGQEQFFYADVPGFLANRSGANNELSRFLKTAHFEGRVLVLNALHDHASLRAAYSAGRELGATHLVFTHCDELIHWGKLMDFLIDGELTPLFLATGPSLSGDCEEDVIGAVLRKTIPGA